MGVFPLRFETPGPVAGSLAGLFVHDLPDDELARYRPAIEAVTGDDVQRVAREHIHPDASAIVLVGDHDQFGTALEAAAFATVEVIRDETPGTTGPLGAADDEVGPVDAGEGGPADGADDPGLPGSDEPADPGDDPDALLDGGGHGA